MAFQRSFLVKPNEEGVFKVIELDYSVEESKQIMKPISDLEKPVNDFFVKVYAAKLLSERQAIMKLTSLPVLAGAITVNLNTFLLNCKRYNQKHFQNLALKMNEEGSFVHHAQEYKPIQSALTIPGYKQRWVERLEEVYEILRICTTISKQKQEQLIAQDRVGLSWSRDVLHPFLVEELNYTWNNQKSLTLEFIDFLSDTPSFAKYVKPNENTSRTDTASILSALPSSTSTLLAVEKKDEKPVIISDKKKELPEESYIEWIKRMRARV